MLLVLAWDCVAGSSRAHPPRLFRCERDERRPDDSQNPLAPLIRQWTAPVCRSLDSAMLRQPHQTGVKLEFVALGPFHAGATL